MKKLIIAIAVMLSVGCNPAFLGDKPFVVTSILHHHTYCIYTCYDAMLDADINAPCGQFNIGDTIKLCK